MDQLRTFVTIAACGSYTRAAEMLYRSQPALSLQIKRLETQLDTQLFTRNGRQTVVTEAGAMLLSYARRILDLNEEAIAKLSVVETEGSVRVGILEEVALGPLVELLTKFGRLCAKIHLELHVSTSWTLSEQIAANTLCLAVANASYAKGLVEPLWEEPYVWACNPDFEVPVTGSLPLVMDPLSAPCALRDSAIRTLDAAGRPWHLAFSSLSLAALQAAVQAGLGIGLLPQSALPPELRILQPEEGLPTVPPVTIALYRGAEATSEAVDLLHGFLHEHLCHPAGLLRSELLLTT